MQIVHFPEQLGARAPNVMGCLLTAEGQWVSLFHVADALRSGEAVTIRHATESELKRAESIVALYEVGFMVGTKIRTLLDQEAKDLVTSDGAAVNEQLGSITSRLVGLLDAEKQGQDTERQATDVGQPAAGPIPA
jgi:hypothetical protein